MNPFLLLIGLIGAAIGLVYLEFAYLAIGLLGLGAAAVLWFVQQQTSQAKDLSNSAECWWLYHPPGFEFQVLINGVGR